MSLAAGAGLTLIKAAVRTGRMSTDPGAALAAWCAQGMVERITWRVLRHRKVLRQRRLADIGAMDSFGTMKITAAIWRSMRSRESGAMPSRIALAPSSR